jgi:type II secretory pathway component PulJ
MNNHRLPAFTIMELTIAMLLSALVIGITYTAFRLVNQSYLDYQRKHSDLSVRIRLDELMQRDFLNSVDVRQSQDGVIIIAGKCSISYKFEQSRIIRLSTVADTFQVVGINPRSFFEHKSLSESDEGKRVDEFSFELSFKQGFFPYHYKKQYSSQILMSQNTHAND